MNKAYIATLFIFTALGLFLPVFPAITGSDDDIARVERKAEIRKLARDIYDRAYERARNAVGNSPTGKKNNKIMLGDIQKCTAESYKHIDAIRAGIMSADEAKRLLIECTNSAINKNPNSELISELRDEFIGEELERLRKTLEKSKQKSLKEEIRKLSI